MVLNNISTDVDTGALPDRHHSLDAASMAGRGRVYVLAALAIFAAVFAYGSWSWVQFFSHPEGAGGDHVVLFTQADFPAIVVASRLIGSDRGSELYDFDSQLQGQRHLTSQGYLALSAEENRKLLYPYPYTPFIALLWTPFADLSPLAQMAVWDIFNIAGMAGGLWFLLASLPLPRVARLGLLLAGLTCLPFIVNLQQGQSSGIVLFAIAGGVALLRAERDLPAGLVLGLLVLKVQWLPFILLVLLWKRRWRALLGIGATIVSLLVITVLAMGLAWILDYLHVLQRAQQDAREFLLDPWYSHSFTGGLAALLGSGSDEVVRAANLLATVLAAVLLLYVWRGRWSPGSAGWDGAITLALLAAIFTNLHLNTRDLCLLVLPAALGTSFIYHSALEENVKRLWYFSIWAAYLVISLPAGLVLSMPIRLTTVMIALMLGGVTVALFRQRKQELQLNV